MKLANWSLRTLVGITVNFPSILLAAPAAPANATTPANSQKAGAPQNNTTPSSSQPHTTQGQNEVAKLKKEPTATESLEKQNKKFQSLESFSRALNLLEAMYVDEKFVGGDALIEKALKGMVGSLDPHTTYLPSSQLRDLTNDTAGKFGGIGIILSQSNDRLEVVEVIGESPAARAGIQSGEFIYAVDKIPVTKTNIEEILTKMRGLPGSSLSLELIPLTEISHLADGTAVPPTNIKKAKLKSVNVTREVIHTSSVTHAKLSDGYAYVKISVFQEDTGEQIDKALRLYESQNGGKLDGLVLDLRNNPGGLLDQAVRVCDLFLDSGIIVSTIGRDKTKQDVEYATKRNTHPYMPLVVLVNEGSASASEIVAGALQDHNRALIIGTVTFGKGSVQSIIPLPNGGGLKMTIARYYTPKGRSIQARGIIPDIPLASSGKSALKLPADSKIVAKDDDERAPHRKESDLEGHIEAADLKENTSLDGFNGDIQKWPANLKGDSQLRVAYTYVRSWSRFSKN